jgi:predicted DNA-binding transcriptional regulator AlpA
MKKDKFVVQPRLLNTNQAAAYLGICYNKFFALGLQMELPRVRLGERDMYDIREIDEWIEKNKERKEEECQRT